MTNHSNTEPEKESPKTEELGQEQADTPDQHGENQQSSYSSRKAGKSKREIMEELSRARFPWDE
ncbi:hypothetical protein PKF023_13790 [Polynucleobacter yangtzensis]|uniref:Uncharacterized protein n=1 Tax=Polynucleobacter yangtzensis TaxID=1743159 RepID=A0A9C7FBT3_9BURK|nr:hypothetical protein [Polynucleobacter yangtzensis]BDT77576.1 hypothetical protein PKF023_13790 [Polynucleobacter yangtzensis]BDT79435.1 hypothetical protein PKF032_13230 [Polynucleobacter yangtzensis]